MSRLKIVKTVFMLTICSIVLMYCYFYVLEKELSPNDIAFNLKAGRNRLPGSEHQKLILLAWNGFSQTYPYKQKTKETCPKCYFTEDMGYLPFSDAVIFHGKHHSASPPTSRPKNQIWVWFFLESRKEVTREMRRQHDRYANLFNWTMTYRHDSDIVLPYGRFLPFVEPVLLPIEDKWTYIASRQDRVSGVYNESLMPIPTVEDLKNRKMAAWIVGNCNSDSGRHVIARELGKFIQIDVYGACGDGKFNCPSSRENLNRGKDCRAEIATEYKFYLALENAICEDYVTEKYFRTMFTQMVPIVYGGANYSRIAPKNSYISVNDFDSFKSLADYLIYLDQNPSEYLKYFEWRKDFFVQNYQFVPEFCTLCDKLWETGEENQHHKTYPDLIEWWISESGNEARAACKSPTDLKIVSNTWYSWEFWLKTWIG